MRRLTPKRAAALPDEQAFREALIERVQGRCELCMADGAEQHEVARSASRHKARVAWFASVWLCVACHRDIESMGSLPRLALGLAAIAESRAEDFNLRAFYDLRTNEYPPAEDVERWRRIIRGARS